MAPYEHFLVIERAHKRFTSGRKGADVQVIEDISIAIDEGELVVFLGPSGCGKTTLMRVVGGLETLTRGRVILEGEEVTGPDRKKGMVFQSYSSFPWLTVIDNIRFGLRFRNDIGSKEKDELARYYLDLVGLKGFGEFYTNQISGGMRQRVAIARTLAGGPDILLMDEPFGALDAQTREFLQVQLLEIRRVERKTVIFVTHDVDEAIFLADRIYMFSARPARILEEINIGKSLPIERGLVWKEHEGFFKLRNHVRSLMRQEAGRAEQEIRGRRAIS